MSKEGHWLRKVVLVPDSFKGTMSSSHVIDIMKDVVLRHDPGCTVVSIPVADGGEGTVDAFLTRWKEDSSPRTRPMG